MDGIVENKQKAKINQDIEERTFLFAVRVIKMVNQLPKVPAVFVMGKQVISSATSVNSNIIQARAGMSRPDFIKHMKIARKEVKETKRWIEMIVAAGLTSSNKTKLILEENEEIIKIIVIIAATPIYQQSCYN